MTVYKYTIDMVRDFVDKKGKGTILLDDKFIDTDTRMNFRCRCGEHFITTFTRFRHRNKRQCNKCGWGGMSSKYDTDTLRKLFMSHGLEPLFESGKGVTVKLPALNSEGYKVVISADKLNQGRNPRAFSKFNPYTIDNINTYLSTHVHGYKLLSKQYKNNSTKLEWKCKYGHIFKMCWGDFYSGKRCARCSGKHSRTNKEFLEDVYDLVSNEYVFLEDFKGVDVKLKVIHNVCDYEYEVTPYKFINAEQRCPRCNESKGEKRVRDYLDSNRIKFEEEYTFDDCRHILPLRFDFAIFDEMDELHSLIEYDGKQHFRPYEFYGGEEEFEVVKQRDSIKNEYCNKNNIELLRIPYTEYENIEEILAAHL